jgi:hypothetical protein
VMKCKDSNCSWRMYATPNITGIWEIKTNPLEHSYFGSATRADHSQMTFRMITDIVKNWLRDNLKMTVQPSNYGEEENWQLQTYLVVGRGHMKCFRLC